MIKQSSNLFVYLGLISCMFFWGGAFSVTKVLAKTLPPYSISMWRFLLASIFLFILSFIKFNKKFKLPSRRQFASLFILALSGIVGYNICFVKAMATVEAGRASVIMSANPVFVFLAAAIFLGERLTFFRVCGMLLSLFGILLTLTKGSILLFFSHGFAPGELWLLGSIASWVVYAVVGRKILYELPPLLITTWSSFFGFLIFVILAIPEGGFSLSLDFTLKTWLLLLFVGFGATSIAFILFHRGVGQLGAQRASAFINLVPLFGIFLAWFFLKEVVDIYLFIGLFLVIGGVVLTQRS